jgi:hypothetical protein
MALGSNAKRKSARGEKDSRKLWIAEWTIEQATTPGHVVISFVVSQESDIGASRSTSRRFLLRCERAVDLVNELKEVLEVSGAFERLEEQAASAGLTFTAQPGLTSVRTSVDDSEPLSNHFALGAYGLVGN